jgi:hypothetical protein
MNVKTVLITTNGVALPGQDGSLLAEFLLDKGYRVFGFARRESWYRPNSASHLEGRIEVLLGDMSEGVDIASAIQDAQPAEIYNLASQARPGRVLGASARRPCWLTVWGRSGYSRRCATNARPVGFITPRRPKCSAGQRYHRRMNKHRLIR